MNTEWTSTVSATNPLPEYPRPQLVRESWMSLNGLWEYAITADRTVPETFDGYITVPFSPEAPLSGVQKTLESGQYLWYRRTLTLPESFAGRRVILHFGAVDQTADVWVNGIHVV